jgi:hypothetical protein
MYPSIRRLLNSTRQRSAYQSRRFEREFLETDIESLERRILLTIAPIELTGNSVEFSGSELVEDALYLRLNESLLEYSESGAAGSYSSDLNVVDAGVQTLTFSAGTRIDIDLGIGDDSIFIDESLRNAITTIGGTLHFTSGVGSADTLFGPHGTWQITADPTNLLGSSSGTGQLSGGANRFSIETTGNVIVVGDIFTDYDLSMTAENITIADGVTVSTRQVANNNNVLLADSTGDSFDVTLSAPMIDVGSGARILTQATGSFVAGDITFDALDDQTGVDTPVFQIDIVNAATRISLDNATIRGGEVSFSAVAESSSQFYDDDEPGAAILNFLADGPSEIGGVAVTNAVAEIVVGTGTEIEGSFVSFLAEADTHSNVTTLGTALAIAYGESNPHARITVADGVAISASGDISVNSLAASEMDITAKQGLYPQKSQSSIDITIASGQADIQSIVEIGAGATLESSGQVSIHANMLQSQNVTSKAAAYEDGSIGGAIAHSTSASDVHAHVDGTIVAGGNVSIVAQSTTEKNDAATDSVVGSGFIASRVIGPANPTSLTSKAFNFIRGNQPTTGSSTGGSQKFALAAAYTYSDHANDVVARIGNGASVTANSGSIDVNATILTTQEVSAQTSVDSQKLETNKPGSNTKENSNAVAVIVASFDNATEAYIGESAAVDAYLGVHVQAETLLPFDFDWHEIDEFSDVSDKFNANLGIQNGLVTSWARSKATGTKTAIAGSLIFNTFQTSSRAYIAENATVNESSESDQQRVTVTAENVVETVNVAGLPLLGGQTTGGQGAGGSYLEMNYINDASAVIHSGAEVNGSSLVVSADTKMRNISLATSGGVADKLAFNGSGSIANVDNRSIARIDDGAMVVTRNGEIAPLVHEEGNPPLALDTNGDGVVSYQDRDVATVTDQAVATNLNQLVVADDDSLIFNLTGGVTKSQSVGIGFSTGINNITRNTQALIGNEATSIGDGTFSPAVGVDTAGNINLGFDHGFATGDTVVYSSGGGVEMDGLTNGATYWVTVIDSSTVRLEKTDVAATGAAQAFFVPAAAVNSDGAADLKNSIDLGYAHNYQTGDSVVYRTGGGQAIDGLADGQTYYVIVVDATSIALTESKDAAENIARISFAAANIDGTTEAIDFLATHDFRTGDAVVYSNGGGVSIDGLVDGETYFVRVDDSQSIFLAATAEAAQLGTDLIDLAAAASSAETHSLRRAVRIELDASLATGDAHSVRLQVAPSGESNDRHAIMKVVDPLATVEGENHTIDLGYEHGFTTGQAIIYDNGGGESIGGLASGETYFVVVMNATTIQLADSRADATAVTPTIVELDSAEASGTSHGFGGVFHDRPAVDAEANTIRFDRQHAYATGDAVTYQSGGGQAIEGLVDGNTYYVIVVDGNTIQLTASEAAATAETPTAIELDATDASAAGHGLRGVDDANGSVTAGGSVRVAAINRGYITNVSLAGAITNDTPTGAKKTQSKEAASTKTKATQGVSVAGSVSLNTIDDTTIAAIRDADVSLQNPIDTTADIGVQATNRSNVDSISGTVAYASAQQATAGLAGSLAVNTLTNETLAVVESSELQTAAGDLFVDAASQGEIRSIAASGSGVTRNATLSIAGQVALNKIDNATGAIISTGSTIDSAAAVAVTATDNNLLHAIAGATTFGGKAGFGASVASNRMETETIALAAQSEIVAGGDMTVSAAADNEIKAITAAIGASKAGMVGAFGVAFNSISATTTASLSDIPDADATNVGGDLLVSSSDASSTQAITGGIAASGTTAGLGGGFAKNNVRNVTAANIEEAKGAALGSLDVTAASNTAIEAITVGGGGAQTFAVGGSLSLNTIHNETSAAVTNSDLTSSSQQGLNVDVLATDNSTIKAISGGAAIATSGVSVGAGIASNIVANTTVARIENSTIDATGAVVADATSTSLIESITVGGAGANTFALGGSVSLNDIQNTIDAHISTGSEVDATGTVRVEATDSTTIRGIAGGVAIATGAAAVGGAFATNEIVNTVTGYIGDSNVEADGFVEVKANATSLLETITAGAGASTNELSGGVSLNAIASTLAAHIASSNVSADHGVKLTAEDDSTIKALSGKAGGAATASIGGAAAFNEMENSIYAYASDSTIDTSAGSLELIALSRATIESITASGSIAGTASVAGSVASNFVGNETQAYLDATSVDAFGNVTVVADALHTVETFAGAIQVGGTLGFGGSVAVTNLDNSTVSYIADSDVSAKGNALSSIPATDGSHTQVDVRGVAVVAISSSDVSVIGANGSGGGTAAVAATVTVQTSDDLTEAYVVGSDINAANNAAHAEQTVIVSASNETNVDVKAGGLSLSGTAGAGATSDTTSIGNTTRAYIADQAEVAAAASIDVTTMTEERVNSITVSGAGAGTAALAGNVVVVNVVSTNEAYVEEATLESFGDINVSANNDVYLGTQENGDRPGIIAGAVGVGLSAAGVGGAVAVNTIENNTVARITDSTVDAANDLAVTANTVEDIVTFAATGAGGLYVGAAGAVTVNTIKSQTLAWVERGDGNTHINSKSSLASANQNVSIDAHDQASIQSDVGAVTVGAASVGAAVDVSTIKNSVRAVLGHNVNVNATESLEVTADANNFVQSTVVSGGGGVGSVQGSVSIVNVGSAATNQAIDAATGTDSAVNDQIGGSSVGNQLGNSAAAERAKSRSDASTNTLSVSGEFDPTQPAFQTTYAAIGADSKVHIGGNILVDANDTTQVKSLAGAGSVGGIGVGGGVAVTNLHNRTNAFIGARADVTAGGNITVAAAGQIVDTDVDGVAGTAGGIGLGAAVAVLNSESDVTARIIDFASVKSGSDIAVTASANSDLHSEADGFNVGITLAVGLNSARTTSTPTVTASIGSGAYIAGNNVTVTATSEDDSSSSADGSSNGLLTGSYVEAVTTLTNEAKVTIGEQSTIVATNTLEVVAESNLGAESDSTAGGIAGTSTGISPSTTNLTSTTTVDIGQSAELLARIARIRAQVTRIDAKANATFASTISLASLAKAEAIVAVDSDATILNRGADIAGYDRLELIARQSGVSARSESLVDAGIVPVVRSVSRNHVDVDSDIDIQAGSALRGTDVLIDASSDSLTSFVIDTDVNSATIQTLDGLLTAAENLLDAAETALDDAQVVFDLADQALANAEDGLADSQSALTSAQNAVDDFIDDFVHAVAHAACITVIWHPPTYNACYATAAAVARAAANWTSNATFRALNSTLSLARSAVSSARTAVNNAQDDFDEATDTLIQAGQDVLDRGNEVTAALDALLESFTTEETGQKREDNSVALNGDLYTGAIVDRVTINPDGTYASASGISGQVVDNEFVMNDIIASDLVSTDTANFIVRSNGGSVSGQFSVHEQVYLAALTINNRSDLDLRVADILADSADTVDANISISASSNSLNTPVVTTSKASDIGIMSVDGTDVVIAGTLDAEVGNVEVVAGDNVTLEGTIRALDEITVRAEQGSIQQVGTAATLLSGLVNLHADHGSIGSATDAVQVATERLVVANAFDLIHVAGASNLVVEAAASGDVMLEASAGNLTGSASGQDLQLNASGNVGRNNSYFTVNGGVASVNSNEVYLIAPDALVVGEVLSDGVVILRSGGDLSLTGQVASSSNVFATSDHGSLLIANNGTIRTTYVYLQAALDVLMSSSDPIVAQNLEAYSIAGSVFLRSTVDEFGAYAEHQVELVETDDIQLTWVGANGAIRVHAGGTITADYVDSSNSLDGNPTDVAGNFVGLISRTGDVLVNDVRAGTSNGQVSLSAAGNIVESPNTDDSADVTAALVMMNAGGDIDVNTAATEIYEFANGKKIRVKTDRSLQLYLETTSDVIVNADGDVTATYIETAGRNINVKSNDGGVFLQNVTTTHKNGKIRIQANGSDGAGHITQQATNVAGIANVVSAAKAIDFNAKGGVTVGGIVQSNQSNVTLSAGETLAITETAKLLAAKTIKGSSRFRDINIEGDIWAAQRIDLRAKGDITVGGTVQTEQKDVFLKADNELVVTAAGGVSAGNNVDLKTRFGDIEIHGSLVAGTFDQRTTRGDIRIDSGGVALITGELEALGEIKIKESI